MLLSGDWSGVGTETGKHELLGFNSAYWTIDQDFTFDGTKTTFTAHATGGYTGENIIIDFILHGGAVPVPPSVLLLGSGLLGIVGWRKFRKV
jgi:hypothetical protein